MLIGVMGSFTIKEFDRRTKETSLVGKYENKVVNNGLRNLSLLISTGAYLVSHCQLGRYGTNYLFDDEDNSLKLPISEVNGGIIPKYDSETIQDDMSVLYRFRFNELISGVCADNALYDYLDGLGDKNVTELGMFFNVVGGVGDMFCARNFYTARFEIKNLVTTIIEYQIKFNRFPSGKLIADFVGVSDSLAITMS